MNYIDRKKLGIELLFSSLSSVTSRMNEITAMETVERLCGQPHRMRKKFAAIINSGIKTITNDPSIDVESYLNNDIKELAQYPVTADTIERLLPFFEWLMEIQRQNSLEMDKSRYSLNDVASHMERTAGEFLRTYSNISGQSVAFARRGDSIVMYAQERMWGRASLVFPDAVTRFSGTFPMLGFLFWVDAEYRDGRCFFSFIVNVEFGDTDPHRRALQDRNWVRLTFESACPCMEFDVLDYGKTLADAGKCGHDFINGWSSELVFKESIIGTNVLSDKEKDLIPMAQIFKIAYQIAEIDETGEMDMCNDMHISDKVLDTLENRYKLDKFKALFQSTGEEELYNKINDAMTAWSCSDFDETSKKIHEFSQLLREKENADTVRPLYKRIITMMCECTAEFNGRSRLFSTYPEAAEKMRSLIEPQLNDMGFEGEFPHYRRRRGKKGEYISVLTADTSEHSMNGRMRYRFELSAAVKKLKTDENGIWTAAGMPFEQTTAEDCRSVSAKNAKFAELGGAYDGVAAVINVDVFDDVKKDDDEEFVDNAAILGRFAGVASDSMKGRRSPRWYRKMRKRAFIHPKHKLTFGTAMLRYMPLGLYITVLLSAAYIICDRFFDVAGCIPQLTGNMAIGIALAVGMLVTWLCSVLAIRSKKKRIWRY